MSSESLRPDDGPKGDESYGLSEARSADDIVCRPHRTDESAAESKTGEEIAVEFGVSTATLLATHSWGSGHRRCQGVVDAPNVLWAFDFQFDSAVDGEAIKIALDARQVHPAFATASRPSRVLRLGDGLRDDFSSAATLCDGEVGIGREQPRRRTGHKSPYRSPWRSVVGPKAAVTHYDDSGRRVACSQQMGA